MLLLILKLINVMVLIILEPQKNFGNNAEFSFALMQEVTRLYGIRENGSDGATEVGSRAWERLRYHLQEIIYPLLTSKYTVTTSTSRSSSVLPSPIYGSSRARSFHHWLTNWACSLVDTLKGERASQVRHIF